MQKRPNETSEDDVGGKKRRESQHLDRRIAHFSILAYKSCERMAQRTHSCALALLVGSCWRYQAHCVLRIGRHG